MLTGIGWVSCECRWDDAVPVQKLDFPHATPIEESFFGCCPSWSCHLYTIYRKKVETEVDSVIQKIVYYEKLGA